MGETVADRVRIEVNGKPMDVARSATVADLLTTLGVSRYVAVELNGQVIPKRSHAQTVLSDGDVVELVTLVGGG